MGMYYLGQFVTLGPPRSLSGYVSVGDLASGVPYARLNVYRSKLGTTTADVDELPQ
ncbi:hypothetical protein EGR_07382 [Echinococcus granulosus]|uniref:Uncharacterized protein n=1 Tax=Echinococcus granulosus TaxID=6210 RepID=W6UI03_ECHGR|nr:hypothetical protein EGR_07382 [Echinococcus granulosus]EUB57722.1 hypothetical protein EGR_07382 [Echinococcus granulosus]